MEIETLMNKLEITKEEAQELLEFDKQVDRMSIKEAESDLNPEQQKVAKKMRQAERNKNTTPKKPTTYNFNRKPTKANEPKQTLINIIKTAIETECSEIEVINSERIIAFKYKDIKYKLVLSVPRK